MKSGALPERERLRIANVVSSAQHFFVRSTLVGVKRTILWTHRSCLEQDGLVGVSRQELSPLTLWRYLMARTESKTFQSHPNKPNMGNIHQNKTGKLSTLDMFRDSRLPKRHKIIQCLHYARAGKNNKCDATLSFFRVFPSRWNLVIWFSSRKLGRSLSRIVFSMKRVRRKRRCFLRWWIVTKISSVASRWALRWTKGVIRARRRWRTCKTTMKTRWSSLAFLLGAMILRTRKGGTNPDRNTQFEFINGQAAKFLEQGLPVIWVCAQRRWAWESDHRSHLSSVWRLYYVKKANMLETFWQSTRKFTKKTCRRTGQETGENGIIFQFWE